MRRIVLVAVLALFALGLVASAGPAQAGCGVYHDMKC